MQKQKGSIINSFKLLQLKEEFIINLDSLEYKVMTKVQEKSLPFSLCGKDIIVQAKTGSGKTVAFSIPLVNKLNVKKFAIQSLVLCPTRELANQVAMQIKKLCRHIHNVKVLTLCGGVPFKPQVASLRHKAHIIVGTPGRVLKHINENNIELEYINTLVLDEADKMLDMGFYEDITTIIEALSKKRQTMLFSATYEKNIEELSSNILNEPIFIKDEEVHTNEVINQKFYKVKQEDKSELIPKLISLAKAKSVLIFCNLKVSCEKIADEIFEMGYDCVILNSDLDQKLRDETLVLFSNKSYPIMIATDVASRGLDIDNIDLIINYDVAKDEKVHTHRIGRTARAGANGIAVTLYTKDEMDKVLEIKEKFPQIVFEETVQEEDSYKLKTLYRTLYINGGKKHKLRAGDIVGTLIATANLSKDDIGNIDIFPFHSYVAIKKEFEKTALKKLNQNKIKGKFYKVYPR